MLISALKLAQSMGSATDRTYTFLDAPGSPPVVIGNARLGLWLGERLLGASPLLAFLVPFASEAQER